MTRAAPAEPATAGASAGPQALIHRSNCSNPRRCLLSGRWTPPPHWLVRAIFKGGADAKSTP